MLWQDGESILTEKDEFDKRTVYIQNESQTFLEKVTDTY